MAIVVTPFIFLLDLCAGLSMAFLFIAYSAHERLNKHPQNRLHVFDSANISLAVVLTSLFLLWSAGCLIGSYFGNYGVFVYPIIKSFRSLLTIEMLIDIFQKTLCFLVLAMASFQMSSLGNHEVLVPWGGVCASVGLIQGGAMGIMVVAFKGFAAWIILYAFSALISAGLCIFSVLSIAILQHNRAPNNMVGYLSNKALDWNIRSCSMILASGALDFFYKALFVLMEVGAMEKMQLLIDILSLCKSASSVLCILSVYSSRIPRDKSYSVKSFN
ncbi:uncharacterized protein NEMAJ01_0060 [Nematocida major]|uniref:uncharacterized protein n=1 Tax=Nematocida major TaxID=1912982 RepID=UPI0020083478|nr:uncharacterized protein NEMAJ01_0060 [Nematocida major]KAH9385164.1 hypothetical protein NEMAJ01_0060 [Nematocida major]